MEIDNVSEPLAKKKDLSKGDINHLRFLSTRSFVPSSTLDRENKLRVFSCTIVRRVMKRKCQVQLELWFGFVGWGKKERKRK